MNQSELQKATICGLCRKPFGHTGLPLFWRVRIERHGVEMDKVRRQDALATLVGSQGIASALSPFDQMTQPMMEPVEITVCETCALTCDHPIAVIAEIGAGN